jgi:hypothetical protein
VSALVARAGVAPLHREPSPRAEQVSQLVLGESARILERKGDWRRVRADDDGYEGWTHAGYVIELGDEASAQWHRSAEAWSEGAVVQEGESIVRLPLRARVGDSEGWIALPDGRRGPVIAGSVRALDEVQRLARLEPPHRWARRFFAGTPYQWGGVTPWGVDCSGLVQTTLRARGTALPRDASQQVGCGAPIDPERRAPGDLLFFVDRAGGPVTHVAFAGENDTLVHSTLSCGGFVEEPWHPGTRAAFLRDRLVAVRRMES